MSELSAQWYAIYTKPRQEDTALLNLERQGFKCYLPMAQGSSRTSRSSGAIRTEPLFPRYLFVCAAPAQQDLGLVRSTRGVVGLVRAGFELVTVPASVIKGLKARMDPITGLISLQSKALKRGDIVRIFHGPFAALEGVFAEYRSQSRSLLLMQILGQETAVEMDTCFMQRSG